MYRSKGTKGRTERYEKEKDRWGNDGREKERRDAGYPLPNRAKSRARNYIFGYVHWD